MSTTTTALQFSVTGLFVPDGRYVSFASPLAVEVRLVEGAWIHELSDLKLSAFGDTREESLEALRYVLLGAWETYALADDSALKQDALEAKQRLLKHVEAVI